MEAIRVETTVGMDGKLSIANLLPGERVEVIVLRQLPTPVSPRELGWAKDWVRILPGFDDPIPGMEDYV
jgi:hypothetical protein